MPVDGNPAGRQRISGAQFGEEFRPKNVELRGAQELLDDGKDCRVPRDLEEAALSRIDALHLVQEAGHRGAVAIDLQREGVAGVAAHTLRQAGRALHQVLGHAAVPLDVGPGEHGGQDHETVTLKGLAAERRAARLRPQLRHGRRRCRTGNRQLR